VIALDDLVNDGSYPDHAVDALLAARGSVGEIVKIGHAQDLNEPVYLVQFGSCVVGCLEIELAPAPMGLLPETVDSP
jgi:nitrogen fixation protein NifZ